MSYFLTASILVAVIAVLYVWYLTNKMRSVEFLYLNTDEVKLLTSWYDSAIKPSYNLDIDAYTVASTLLKRVYNIDVNPKDLVIGHDLESQCPELKRGKNSDPRDSMLMYGLEDLREPQKIFNLRDILGIDGEIAIIPDKKTRESVVQSPFDYRKVNDIISSDIDIKTAEYLRKVLKDRWSAILRKDNGLILNYEGSYLYLKGDTEIVFDNVVALKTSLGLRINLLCTDFDFDMFLERWKKSEQQMYMMR